MEDNKKKNEETENSDAKYEKVSYWEVAWGQVKKNKVAIFGLICIALFIIIAVYAPLITMSRPFYYSAPGGYELTAEVQQELKGKLSDEKITLLNEVRTQDWYEITKRNLKTISTETDISPLESIAGKKFSKDDLAGYLIKNGFKSREIEDILSKTQNNKFTEETLTSLLVDNSFDKDDINKILTYSQVKTSYPFFTALFDRNYFKNGVDIFYNVLMVLSPFFLIAYFLFKMQMGKKFKEFQELFWQYFLEYTLFYLWLFLSGLLLISPEIIKQI